MEDEDRTHGCLRINGVGVFDTFWVFGQESNICTCGALPEGTPWEPMTMHELTCSTVPCPMCLLEQELNWPEPGGDTITQNSAG